MISTGVAASPARHQPIAAHGRNAPYDRVVPLIVATALFMENMDSTVIATSLPAIARALGTNPLALKLAVTSYLLVACDLHPGERLDRRPVRRAQRVPHRHRHLRARLDRLRRLAFARRIRVRPHLPGHGRRDDDAGRPPHHGAQHRQEEPAQCHVAGDHAGADRPDLRPAARRLHHHLCVLALDFLDQRADRARRHRVGVALYRQCPRRAPRPVRLCRLRPVRPRHCRPCLRAFGDGARFPADRHRRGAACGRRGVGRGLRDPRQAHAGADPRSVAAQAADASAPASSAAFCSGSASARCRSCCRYCCRSASI